MAQKANLVSVPTLVQSPFVIATIGGVTFGSYSGNQRTRAQYPNYMTSLSIDKVNGTVNSYTMTFSYKVGIGQDPNLLDKIFSRATKDRRVTLKYGDWLAPSYIYKEEQCLITNVTERLNMSNASIDYVVQCVSDAVSLTSTSFNFPAREAKGSDVLTQMLNNNTYGLKKVFTGMRNIGNVLSNNLIASNDKKIKLLPQKNITPLQYMNYVVGSMESNKDSNSSSLNKSKYFLTVHDDYSNNIGGTYFKVTEVSKDKNIYDSTNTYELDVNFPQDNFITEFTVNNDQSWALLYEFSEDIKQEEYQYSINDDGQIVTTFSPSIITSETTNDKSAYKTAWWSLMTEFPITATLTLKGLTRPSMLMTYVKLNVWFSGGQKHISSGTYIITKQVDTINSSGYSTTLSLLRVGGDS